MKTFRVKLDYDLPSGAAETFATTVEACDANEAFDKAEDDSPWALSSMVRVSITEAKPTLFRVRIQRDTTDYTVPVEAFDVATALKLALDSDSKARGVSVVEEGAA